MMKNISTENKLHHEETTDEQTHSSSSIILPNKVEAFILNHFSSVLQGAPNTNWVTSLVYPDDDIAAHFAEKEGWKLNHKKMVNLIKLGV